MIREDIRGYIGDAIVSSLNDSQAAVTVLQRVNGATPNQLLAAALDLLREQARQHREIVAGLEDDVANLGDDVAEFEVEVEVLRAQLAKLRETAS
jgi:hypothetical protein